MADKVPNLFKECVSVDPNLFEEGVDKVIRRKKDFFCMVNALDLMVPASKNLTLWAKSEGGPQGGPKGPP